MSDPLNQFGRPKKTHPYWTLPEPDAIVAALRVVGGNLAEMLNRLSDDALDQAQLIFLMEEELAKPENEAQRKLWEKYQLLYYKSQISLGTATLLKDYASGKADKLQLVKDIGKQILPGVFAPGIGIGGKDVIEQQVDGHLAKYGQQPEEPDNPV